MADGLQDETAGVQLPVRMVDSPLEGEAFPDNGEKEKPFENHSTDFGKQGNDHEDAQFITKDPSESCSSTNDWTYKLHEAAKHNDIEAIKIHIEAGHELGAEDQLGVTPLLNAVMYKNYEAAKLLRRAQVDILVSELYGRYASPNNYYRHKVEIVHTNCFVQKMIDQKFDPVQIGTALAAVNCCIDEVVCCRDPVLTKAYLQSYANEEVDPTLAFPDDMLGFDVEHIKVLINHGPRSKYRKEDFIWVLFEQVRRYQRSAAGRDFLRKLACWEILDEEFIAIFEKYLQKLPREVVRIILKYDFQSISNLKYGRDISRMLFGNCCHKAIWLLKNGKIDVDRRYRGGDTPLHIASKYYAAKNIQVLLAEGANPNAFNDERDTPLSLVLKSDGEGHPRFFKSIKYLLIAGANPINAASQFEDTFFSFDSSTSAADYAMDVIRLLVAQLAIYEAVDLSIEQYIKLFMTLGSQELERYLEKCRQELKLLKTQEIQDNRNNKNPDYCKMEFTIFTILAEKPENIARCINEEQLQIIEKLTMTFNKKSLNLYYRELLRQRVKRIIELSRYRNTAIQIVCQFTRIHDPSHLVVRKIVNYFTVQDLMIFKKINEKKYKQPQQTNTIV